LAELVILDELAVQNAASVVQSTAKVRAGAAAKALQLQTATLALVMMARLYRIDRARVERLVCAALNRVFSGPVKVMDRRVS
jgi:hypothetical protein